MLLFMSMCIGHFNSAAVTLRNSYFRALGKLSFEANLLAPILIMLLYSGQEYAIYLTIIGGTMFGLGHVLVIVIVSLLMYFLIEYPV